MSLLAQSETVIEGLVLCRVGADRLAVRAQEVTAFEAAAEGALYAGVGFQADARPPPDAKLIRHRTSAVVVDAVEVHAERLKLLAVPEVLRRAWGGALAGFVETGGVLWPVLSLERLSGSGA